jgi:hypothetical protein
MTIEPDPFERLSRVMALKKYEKPPPGYFENFSDRVIARIEADQFARSLPWWQNLLSGLSFRPALAGAFGLMVSAGVLAGILFSGPVAQNVQSGMMAAVNPIGDAPSTMIAMEQTMPSSTDPVPSSMPSYNPFNQPIGGATRVSFSYR